MKKLVVLVVVLCVASFLLGGLFVWPIATTIAYKAEIERLKGLADQIRKVRVECEEIQRNREAKITNPPHDAPTTKPD